VQPNAAVVRDGTTGKVTQSTTGSINTIELGSRGQVELPACSLVGRPASPAADPDTRIGTDLLGWGSLDDGAADRSGSPAMNWLTDGTASERFDRTRHGYLYLESDSHSSASARQVARSTLPEHRWYRDGEPVGDAPAYTVQLDLRRGGDPPTLKFALYDVNDTDPTVEPTSTLLHESTVSLPATDDGKWETVSVDVTDIVGEEYGGVRPEAVLVYVVAPPPDSRISIDNIRLFEWRALSELPPDTWVAADALRGDPDGSVTVSLRGCG
jgi:hypothetical protein